MAFAISSKSFPSSTRIYCHPYALKRSSTLSENDFLNLHLEKYHLNHIKQLNVLILRCPASEAASAETPSIKSPSPQILYV